MFQQKTSLNFFMSGVVWSYRKLAALQAVKLTDICSSDVRLICNPPNSAPNFAPNIQWNGNNQLPTLLCKKALAPAICCPTASPKSK